MGQIPISLITLVVGVAVTLASIWIGQHNGLLPEQASIQAPLVDNFFNTMIGIAFALFVFVQGAIILFAIQYRQRKGDETDGVPVEGNVPLEAFWTLIPSLIVMGLGIYSVDVFAQMGGFAPAREMAAIEVAGDASGDATYDLALTANSEAGDAESLLENKLPTFGYGATKTADLTVDVTGMQYAWLFNYPKYDILAGELHVPINQAVQLNIQAQDVIHSFWVPQFRLKQDAIPGQPTQLNFTANRPGTYPVVCAELCGAYHGGMRTQVVVESEEEFAAWVEENQVVAQTQQDNALAFQPQSGSGFADEHLHHMGLSSDIQDMAF